VRYRETAPPEVWAEAAARHRLEADMVEQQMAQEQAAQAAAANQGGGGDASAGGQGDGNGQSAGNGGATCPEGTTYDGFECQCPSGMLWGGSACYVPTQAAAQAPAQRSSFPRSGTTVIVHPTAPPPRTVSNPAWHAILQGQGAASCQVFAGDPYGRAGNNMAACSRWCTPHLAARHSCQCNVGGC
jgi:hypothetical protein